MWPLIGLAAGAAGGIGGALINKGAHADDRAFQEQMFEKNRQMQLAFAQQGIQWKMQDAERAGLHPLIGAGAQTQSFSPISVGSSPDYSMGNAMASMGQDIGRAISATQNEEQRLVNAIQIATAKANLDGQLIENDMKSVQLNKLRQVGPGFPMGANLIEGQGNTPLTGLIRVVPKEQISHTPGSDYVESGRIPEVSYSATHDGVASTIPKDLAEQYESDPGGYAGWLLRNRTIFSPDPPSHKLRNKDNYFQHVGWDRYKELPKFKWNPKFGRVPRGYEKYYK